MRTSWIVVCCVAALAGCKSPRSADAPAEQAAPAPERPAHLTPGGVPLADMAPAVRQEAMRLARDPEDAVEALVGLGAEALPAMRALLQSDNLREVGGALAWYGRVRPEGTAEDVAGILDHPARSVREDAVDALLAARARGAADALARRLGTEPAPLLRARVAAALRTLEAKDAVPALLQALTEAAHPLVAAEAGHAAAALGGEEATKTLAERAAGEGALPAYGALYGLRRAGAAPPIPTLKAALGREDVRVAAEAIRATRHAPEGDEVTALLEQAAADQRPEVRRAALLARAERQPEQAAKHARAALSDASAEVRAVALGVLAEALPPADALAALVGHAGDASAEVRATVAVHVERLAGKEDVDAASVAPRLLARLDAEEDAFARQRLVRALGAVGGRATAEALLPVVDREGEPARDEAREALQRITGGDAGYTAEKWRPLVEALPTAEGRPEAGEEAPKPRSGGAGR